MMKANILFSVTVDGCKVTTTTQKSEIEGMPTALQIVLIKEVDKLKDRFKAQVDKFFDTQPDEQPEGTSSSGNDADKANTKDEGNGNEGMTE